MKIVSGHEYGADRVDVLQRVEGDAAEPEGGRIAAAVGDPAMGGLMHGDREQAPAAR
jgi:hypothetical protein